MKIRVLKAGVVFLALTAAFLVFRANLTPSGGKSPASATTPDRSEAPSRSTAQSAVPDAHETKVLELALKKKPGHTPVLLRLAKLASESGHNKEAEQDLREALRNEPGNVDARLELGKVLFQEGDVAGAIRETSEILKTQPAHPDALYNLGAIYGNLGNSRLALDYWNRLIAADPQSESGKRARQMIAQLPHEPR